MRLTIYLEEAPVVRTEVMTKDGPVFKKIVHNTLSFRDIKENEVSDLINSIDPEKQGKYLRHTLSADRATGHARIKRKK